VKQPGQIGTGRHPDAGEGFFDGAGAANALPRLEDEDALASTREVGGAGESVVAGAYDERGGSTCDLTAMRVDANSPQ
jgi:hypothetical protein